MCCCEAQTDLRRRFIISISGLVVEYIVAIDVTRARFPADAILCLVEGILSKYIKRDLLCSLWHLSSSRRALRAPPVSVHYCRQLACLMDDDPSFRSVRAALAAVCFATPFSRRVSLHPADPLPLLFSLPQVARRRMGDRSASCSPTVAIVNAQC